MYASGVGSHASSAQSGNFSSAYYAAASQRMMQLKGSAGSGYKNLVGSPFLLPDKDRLVPSRRTEESVAVKNLQRRVELTKMLHSSVNEDFMRTVFGRKMTLENVMPSFLKKVVHTRPTTFVYDEDCQEDIHDNEFIQEALLWHNVYRRHHNVPPLKLSTQLCGKAQWWANHLAHANTFFYESDKMTGQNIFCRLSADAQIDISAQEIVSYWYSCYKNYTYTKEPVRLHVNINAGNFTQLIWKSTKYFGIGRARSRAGKILVVANYQPPGNINGLFQQNVLPALANNRDFCI